jgi:hypothetical protein
MRDFVYWYLTGAGMGEARRRMVRISYAMLTISLRLWVMVRIWWGILTEASVRSSRLPAVRTSRCR